MALPPTSGHPAMTVPRDAGIVPLKFWTESIFNTEKPDEPINIDWVEFAPVGRAGTTMQEKVERLRKHNAIVWPQIERHYEHWKKGQDMPVDGTPLIAWPGFPEGMIRRLLDLHIKTVEDFATLTDAGLERVGMGAREWQRQALAFLNNADRAAAAKKQADIEAQNVSLVDQLAELKAELAALKKPKRGKAAAEDDD